MRITENTEFEVIEPGTYPAEVVEWTDVDKFGKPLMSKGFADREPSPQWQIKFRLEVEGEERFLSKWINIPKGYPETVHPKATIALLARAVLGDAADTTDWDIPDLIEGKCRIQVEVYDKADGSQGNSIGKFYPLKTAKPATPAASGREPAQPIRPRQPEVQLQREAALPF